MKIPFDIKYRPQIESGEYTVVTRGGHPARIVCWDAKYAQKIVAVSDNGDYEAAHMYDVKGMMRVDGKSCDADLLIENEPPLTEDNMNDFQRYVYGIIDTAIEEERGLRNVCDELLKLACKQIDIDMPRWKKVDGEIYCREAIIVKKADRRDMFDGFSVAADHTLTPKMYDYYIEASELDKLPKKD